MEFITKYSDSVLEGTFEVFTKPTMTEPDNAMSIPEIIARFTRGQGIPVTQHPWSAGSAFDDEANPDDLQDFLEVKPANVPADRASIDEASQDTPVAGNDVKNQSEGAQ